MNKGDGETSYAKNSLVQLLVQWWMPPLLIFYGSYNLRAWRLRTLGARRSGANSLAVVSQIIHRVYATSHEMGRSVPELKVSLNDLPGNDFNHVFQLLPELYKKLKNDYGIEDCFVVGLPGSFYGRLFPSRSLHFVHSSSSLHWLSQVPVGLGPNVGSHLNKEKIYISKSGSASVVEAYRQQFHEDFSMFLRSRAKEMIIKGRMVLSFIGRMSPDPSADEACYQWELLARALMSLAYDGLVEKKMIDSLNAPYYAPSLKEVEHEVENEGSFGVCSVEAFKIEWDSGDSSIRKESSGDRVAKTVRAVVEPMLGNHFHLGPEKMDVLFQRYAIIIDDCFSKRRFKYTNLVISLVKKKLIAMYEVFSSRK